MVSIPPRYNPITPTPMSRPWVSNAMVNSPAGLPTPPATSPLARIAESFSLDDAILNRALQLLGGIKNLPQDEAYMQHLGIPPIFHSGQEALSVIKNNGIKVEFGDMGDSTAHAQWMSDQKTIMINAKYRGDTSPATLYAISEAIYHEAGHAAQIVTDPRTGQRQNLSLAGLGPSMVGDDQSSIQEESECLALNTLAHRYHEAIDPAYAQASSESPLLRNGVQLYSKLFFDADPYKKALINRIVEKYGELPVSSPGHEPPPAMEPIKPLPLAYRVIQKIQAQNSVPASAPWLAMPANGPQTPRLAYWA